MARTTESWTAYVDHPWLRRFSDSVHVQLAHRRVQTLDALNLRQVQTNTLLQLVRHAATTQFGRDHDFFAIRSPKDYQDRVPLRDYTDFWSQYWSATYPRLSGTTWPEPIPYYALSSGTTTGTTKYIPITNEMLKSNKRAALSMLSLFRHAHPRARTLTGRVFFLGGSTDLRPQADGSFAGDLSGIAAKEVYEIQRLLTFPPLELSLITDWDEKLRRLAEASLNVPISAISGVPSWMLKVFDEVLRISGKKTLAQAWPDLRLVIHGGTIFEPYRQTFQQTIGSDLVQYCEVYPCSEGFIATEDPRYRKLRILPDHGLVYEFVPLQELNHPKPTRHFLWEVAVGVPYAVVLTTCAGLWSYILGDTIEFESVDPPLIRFTGRTKYFLSAFGEHLIQEEIDHAVSHAAARTQLRTEDHHVGPIFPVDASAPGHHRYYIEFRGGIPEDLNAFIQELDTELSRLNEDYAAHRVGDLTMRCPEVVPVAPGGFAAWMKSRGKYGGQNKVPRMDNTGQLTQELGRWLRDAGYLPHSRTH